METTLATVTIPAEGIWFDCQNDDAGSARTYWRGGQVVLRVGVAAAKDGRWGVVVAWTGPEKTHTHEFGPFVQRETAEQLAIAVGIGVQVVMPSRHISQIPGYAKAVVSD